MLKCSDIELYYLKHFKKEFKYILGYNLLALDITANPRHINQIWNNLYIIYIQPNIPIKKYNNYIILN